MQLLHLANLATLFSLATAQVDFNAAPQCSKYQIITARGTGQQGYGTVLDLTNQIKGAVPNSESVYLEWPASLLPTYPASVQAGIDSMTRTLRYFVDGCPNTQIIILGYSQGAHVTLNTLCGWMPGGPARINFDERDPIAAEYRDRVIGIAAFGDPTHVYPEPYDRGTSVHDGEFPRLMGECSEFNDRLASWCNTGDQVCDDGADPAVHQEYFATDQEAAFQHIISRVSAAPAVTAVPPSTSTSTKTTTGAASPTHTGSAAMRLTPPNFLMPFKVLGLVG